MKYMVRRKRIFARFYKCLSFKNNKWKKVYTFYSIIGGITDRFIHIDDWFQHKILKREFLK